MLRKIWMIGRDLESKMGKQNISAFAASTAFFFFLSLVPMLMLICTVLPYTPLTEENLLVGACGIIPEKIFPLLEQLIYDVYEKSAGVMSAAIIVILWTAGKGMLALIRGLNAVGDVKETRNYVHVRAVATFYTMLMLIMVVISLLIMVFGNRLVDMLLYKIPKVQYLVAFLLHFRFMAVWGILTFVFAAIYAFVPNGRLNFKEQIPGAAFSAVGWNVFSWGFSIYVDHADYSIYGSLSIIILVMLWMYFCMYIIMVGAYLNRYFRPINRVLFGRKKQAKEK